MTELKIDTTGAPLVIGEKFTIGDDPQIWLVESVLDRNGIQVCKIIPA